MKPISLHPGCRIPKVAAVLLLIALFPRAFLVPASADEKIRWVDFTVTAAALKDTADADIASHGSENPLDWIDLLAFLGQKYGGNFKNYRRSDLTAYLDAKKTGTDASMIRNGKLYHYYLRAFGAALGGLLGEHTALRTDRDGNRSETAEYGVMGFYPIASGYSTSGSDDFGNTRSYGYRRRHLGHDLFGSVGIPIIAVEGGFIEALGWNQYGGWRVGIRSLDSRRYYYYAHLRRGHPYPDLSEGDYLPAGSVIGYLGMTGYSAKENVNNIRTPHLHFGIQLIFTAEQKDGVNQIWINPYEILTFLRASRAPVRQVDGEFVSSLTRIAPGFPD